MNIFKILSSHDGSINEPNVSSFLAYLLDPLEDHGMSGNFLQSFFQELIKQDQSFLKDLQFNNGVTDLSRQPTHTLRLSETRS